jgi:P27 family predicted phage terminase small subunit
MEKREPPKHLHDSGREYWQAVTGLFVLEDHHYAILQTACEALDRAAEARKEIERLGVLIVPESGGMARANPATRTEKDSMVLFLRAQQALGLDLDEPGPVGRPPGR